MTHSKENLDEWLGEFRKYIKRAQHFEPISYPGMMLEVLKYAKGQIVADIGCGAGLFSHIAKCGWYHSESYLEDPEKHSAPILIGVEVNKWQNKYYHNYDFFLQGVSTDLGLPDKSVDTLVCIENIEHLTKREVSAALREFVRVSRQRIIITTPSPLAFLDQNTFQKRAILLPRYDISLDKFIYAKIASAIHKTCIDVKDMLQRGFDLLFHNTGSHLHPIYVKTLEHSPSDKDTEYRVSLISELVLRRQSYPVDAYIESLELEYPLDLENMSKYSDTSVGLLEEIRRKDAEVHNYRIYYLNLVCESLKENDSIRRDQKIFYENIIPPDNRTSFIKKIFKKTLQLAIPRST